MSWLSRVFEIPELLSFMFLPNLTDQQREDLSIDRLFVVFLAGVLFGMIFLGIVSLFLNIYRLTT